MHAPSHPACLLRFCRLRLLARRQRITTRRRHDAWFMEIDLSPYATAPSQRRPQAACVTVQAPFTACFLWHDHNPLQFGCSENAPVLLVVYLSTGIALEKLCVKVFYAARLRRPPSNDVPEHYFFVLFVHFRNSLMSSIGAANMPDTDTNIAVAFPHLLLTMAFARCCWRIVSPITLLCTCGLYGLTVPSPPSGDYWSSSPPAMPGCYNRHNPCYRRHGHPSRVTLDIETQTQYFYASHNEVLPPVPHHIFSVSEKNFGGT